MRLYQLGKLGGLDALQLNEAQTPRPGIGQVVVRIRACSLNHRDLNIVSGGYTSVPLKPGAIPLSDGAGEIAAVGPDVTRWKVGDRVAPIFVQRWIGGNLLPEYMPSALGGPSDGVLAEQIVRSQEGLVRIPALPVASRRCSTRSLGVMKRVRAILSRDSVRSPRHE